MDSIQKDNELLANIKSHLPELVALLKEMNSRWLYEDPSQVFLGNGGQIRPGIGAGAGLVVAIGVGGFALFV
jgi:hypothetical protein